MTAFYDKYNTPRLSLIYMSGSIIMAFIIFIMWRCHHCYFADYNTHILWGTTGAWLLVSIAYKISGKNTAGGWIALLTTATILFSGIVINLEHFSDIYYNSQGAIKNINGLTNPDSMRYWDDALAHYTNGTEGFSDQFHHRGYGLAISWLWQLTGCSLTATLLLNTTLILLTIILSGEIATRVINSQCSTKTIAMIMTAMVCYFVNSGTLVLKEAPLCFSMATAILGLTGISNPSKATRDRVAMWICIVCGVLLTALFRYTFVLYLALAAPLLYIRKTSRPGECIAAIAVCAAIYVTAKILTLYHAPEIAGLEADAITGKGITGSFFFETPQHHTYNSLIEGYLHYPFWLKALLLPFTAAVQFLVPFPWGFGNYGLYAPTMAYAHFGYTWYLIGGLMIYTVLFELRKAPKPLARITIWAIAMWLIPAFLFAGTVSRYSLPLIPMLIPAAVYAWQQRHGNRKLLIYGCIYILLVTTALISAHQIQHNT